MTALDKLVTKLGYATDKKTEVAFKEGFRACRTMLAETYDRLAENEVERARPNFELAKIARRNAFRVRQLGEEEVE